MYPEYDFSQLSRHVQVHVTAGSHEDERSSGVSVSSGRSLVDKSVVSSHDGSSSSIESLSGGRVGTTGSQDQAVRLTSAAV